MSKIGKNIRKIRSLKKLSQTDFANLFNLSRTSVGAYEEERAEPKINTLIEIGNYFGISVDRLLNEDLTVNTLSKFDIFKVGEKSGSPTTITPVAFGGTIPLILKDESEKYIQNFLDNDYLLRLPTIFLPLLKKSSLRAFVMNSHGMTHDMGGIHFDDLVIARKVAEIKSEFLHINQVYVFITKKKITIRRLLSKEDTLIIKGDSSNYTKTALAFEDILEMWHVEGFYSSHLFSPNMVETRIENLENDIKNIQDFLKKTLPNA